MCWQVVGEAGQGVSVVAAAAEALRVCDAGSLLLGKEDGKMLEHWSTSSSPLNTREHRVDVGEEE